jgi:tetratricopeptide (TPR) repeat protein
LKGRFHWNKRTDEGIGKSIEYFNKALELDPNYALAYSGLADSWFTSGWYRYKPPAEAYARSKAAANKAVEIDPKLAEAHVTIAMVKGVFEWDWAGAENEFKLALQLNPRYATAHHRYSLFLPILGRLDEAIAEAKKAQELDPLSLIINENVGDILSLARRYDEAEQQLLKTIELDPNFDVAHQTLANVYESKGMYEKSLEQAFWNEPNELARQKKIYAQSGQQGIWRDMLQYLLDRAKSGEVRPFWIAGVYARLGDKDKCFEWLDKALEERSVVFTYLIADDRFDNIRSDPRYTALLQRIGLQKK